MYTDGSKKKNGCAFGFKEKHNNFSSIRLIEKNSIYQAAITETISWAIKMNLSGINVYSNSNSVIPFLCKLHTTNPFIINLLKLISDNIQLHISLIWIKRNNRYTGNCR